MYAAMTRPTAISSSAAISTAPTSPQAASASSSGDPHRQTHRCLVCHCHCHRLRPRLHYSSPLIHHAPLIFAALAALHLVSSPPLGLALLLSDLPTPSLVLDVRAMRKRYGLSSAFPSLWLPKHDEMVLPFAPETHTSTTSQSNQLLDAPSVAATTDGKSACSSADAPIQLDLTDHADQSALVYFHTSVVRSRSEVEDGHSIIGGKPLLAELDLRPSLCGSGARLVLGLNNHHVGSYYWARSAGAGSSMDAIGVEFVDAGDDKGVLCWEDEGGPMACNSNDGKRSEWVNFLRRGDTVQLVPMGSSGEDALLAFLDMAGGGCIFGVSSECRPLGSEPEVVCVWKRESKE